VLTPRNLAVGMVTGMLTAVLAAPVAAQETPGDDLKQELQTLREMLEAIQKDVREIKSSLERRAGSPSPVGTVIDLSSNPSKGEQTAKLTLVEFSDYQ
jgi:gas vesicle protein